MEKRQELYRGKAKTVFETDDPSRFILHFRDDTSAFDGERIEQLDHKGRVNNLFNAFVMERLASAQIPTHFEKVLNDRESVVKRLDMIPVECVVRNVAAGSLTKRLGIAEGTELRSPIFELFLKNDALHDPMINESHIEAFGWAKADEIGQMRALTLRANDILKKLFDEVGIILVDYKLEFGRFDGAIVLGDEFSPDGCRLWDKTTREKLDKDRFRRSLGGVVEAYQEVARRIGVKL